MKKTLLKKEYYNGLVVLYCLLFFALIASGVIFYIINKGKLIEIKYNYIREYSYYHLFISIYIRNLIYFIAVGIAVMLGFKNLIYVLFCLVSIYFGISIIYLFKTVFNNISFGILSIFDYLVYFPFLFFFTFVSEIYAGKIKKNKQGRKKSKQLAIVAVDYIKKWILFFTFLTIFSMLYSMYIFVII